MIDALPCSVTVVEASGMDDKLLEIVMERLEKSSLEERVADLLLAPGQGRPGELVGSRAHLEYGLPGSGGPGGQLSERSGVQRL
jgi:hypothetical protein